MKENNKLIAIIFLVIIITGFAVINSYNYDEPVDGLDVNASISEIDEKLRYEVETDFIPKAKYTVGLTVNIPLDDKGPSAYISVPLKEKKLEQIKIQKSLKILY